MFPPTGTSSVEGGWLSLAFKESQVVDSPPVTVLSPELEEELGELESGRGARGGGFGPASYTK